MNEAASAEETLDCAAEDEVELEPLSPLAPQAVREMALIAARAVILAKRFVTAHPSLSDVVLEPQLRSLVQE
ncbi:hypothetical protein HMPREF9622_02563 [Cutibacterium modestum HL037PA3]|uniref:Uncharacterized protein n=1 Tax=Cutibacterium modestum HL044PA1 TaxID=765109 RepID=A0ABP2K6G6_9ACTN|nr:hypothetical protein HMPREF9621_02370 [Cutibacterium modestum HL037PA2]EFS92503.1 hypothetical protein HMPREF9607_01290 [Cutibacterium modestum HL044PA1]EFT14409.1 hypothetical protein HMPREF9622_02563 [Cutibacterium modestum HL037PA3]